jgi:hypothetical protein
MKLTTETSRPFEEEGSLVMSDFFLRNIDTQEDVTTPRLSREILSSVSVKFSVSD